MNSLETRSHLRNCSSECHFILVTAALVTHHHWDHAGGMGEFRKIWSAGEAQIYGGDERIDHLSHKMFAFSVLCSDQVTALHTPCHTRGHICYYVTHPDSNDRIVLTGDTLFIAGCGKFFEGNGSEMHHNLNEILAKLPDDTLVYPGHEYTYSNLKFAHHIEPSNESVKRKLEWASQRRERNEPTVPSTIAEEKETNPFMRMGSAEIQKKVGATDPAVVMDRVREEKNSFRG
ncbi:unnamed protein product [Heligmosomoides polygyrus]|uniref:hydroxyacylglutathione hydrolase n=1 Tax=Heligmosomoides polygyrus TaxID=6339 RepID=A0A3P7ZBS5_HELPZ|nr:unnamed protein product [Heligmosomoides polygyrus]